MDSPDQDAAAPEPSAQLDLVVAALGDLRAAAGDPSFGDIALGVSRVRRERGAAPALARVGRTTVYDAFRTGRRRLDADLVADVVRALGGDEAAADEMAARCRAAQSGGQRVGVPTAPTAPTVIEPLETVVAGPASMARRAVMVIVVGSVLVNLAGRSLVDLINLPVYLDMVGTAVSAIALGPWWGALVGVLTNGFGVIGSGTTSWWFIPVNVAGALVWGYGVRRWGMARSIPRFFMLNVWVALTCTLIAAVIIVGFLDGSTGHSADDITGSVLELGQSLWVSVGVSNLLTSLTDKLIAGFAALALIEALPASWLGWRPSSWLRRSP